MSGSNYEVTYSDIPQKRVSVSSVQSKDPEKDENEGLQFDATAGEISLDPPADDAFGYLINSAWYRKLRSVFLVSTYQRVHGSVFRSHYGVYQERARHLASYPWIIHPQSTFRWCWDIILSILLIATLIGQPILITFYSDELRDSTHVIISCVQGFVFFMDIVLNFRTGYVSSKTDTIVLDSSVVYWHYVKTWFFVDLLSTIPYDALFVILVDEDPDEISPEERIFKYVRLLELLKIFRVVRVIRYLTRFQEAYMIDSLYIRVINLHITIFFTLHWIGCLHYLVADMFNPEVEGSVRNSLSWVSRLDLWDATVGVKYINSIIRAISNMACLGYGAEVPRSMEDILCTIFSILVGATFFALFVGNLSSILINVDVAQKKYAEVINQVSEYMRFKQIPKELQSRVLLYYEHRYRRNFFNEVNILLSLSDVLRQELQMFNCRRLVEEVPLFHGLPTPIVQNIVGRLQFEVYLPQDIIIGAHTLGDAMYFIEHGAVSVVAPNGRAVAHLRDGDFFGEMALLSDERRNATVIATSYCDMYRLERDDFEESIVGYPEIYDKLAAITAERIQKNSNDVSMGGGQVPPQPERQPPKWRNIYQDDDEYSMADLNEPTDSAVFNQTVPQPQAPVKDTTVQQSKPALAVSSKPAPRATAKPKKPRRGSSGSSTGSLTELD